MLYIVMEKRMQVIITAAVLVLSILITASFQLNRYTLLGDSPRVREIVRSIKNTEAPVVQITATKVNASVSTVGMLSKIGGTPFSSEVYTYPVNGVVPLCFLSQINLSDVPETELLPQKGLLQFFVSCDADGRIGYVRYAPIAESVILSALESQKEVLGEKSPSLVNGEYVLSFTATKELKSDSVPKKDSSMVMQYANALVGGDYSKIGGHNESSTRAAAGKQLLAQFKIESSVYAFYISESALKSRDFSDVVLVLQ
jgi:hypothetical protein